MLPRGAARKVTIYVNEDTTYRVGPLYEAILTYLLHKGVAGATATRAIEGFGGRRRIHTSKIEVLSEHLPIRIEFVETAARVEELLPDLYEMVNDGLIEVQDTYVVKSVIKGKKPEPARPHERRQGKAKLMRVYMGEADEWHGEPLYEAIVKRLQVMDILGATVHRGILGYGAKGHTHRESFLHLSRDLPVMVVVVESEAKIRQAEGVIESMLGDGLIVTSDVDMIRLVHSPSAPEVPDVQ
jgi:PII-like signaling protein